MSEEKKDVLDDISKQLVSGAKNISEKIEELAKKSKIHAKIFELNNEVKESKLKIGNIVYSKKLNDLSSDIEEYIKEIDMLNSDIRDVKKEMEEVKNKKGGK